MFRVVQRRVRMAIKQEPYLGFNAMGDVYLAGAASAQATARLSEAAEAWDRTKDTTSISALPLIFPLLYSWLVAMNFDGDLIAGVTDRHELLAGLPDSLV
jgi:hypothetical protein